MFLALVNTGPRDRLVSVSRAGHGHLGHAARRGRQPGADRTVLLTGPQPEVVLNGLTHSLAGGQHPAGAHFQNAGTVSLSVPVFARASYYSTYSPAPSPTPTPTATEKHRHRGSRPPRRLPPGRHRDRDSDRRPP